MIQKPYIENSEVKRIFDFNILDLRNILDEIPQPSLVINYIDGRVISANYHFSELFQIEITEIINLRIHEIVPEIDLKKINDGESKIFTIFVKNRQALKARITPRFISKTEKLLLLIFLAENKVNLKAGNSWEEFAKEQTSTLSRIYEFSHSELLDRIIKIGVKITSSDEVVFYLKQDSSVSLKRYPSVSKYFPDQIPTIELNRIKEVDFWEPGKRILSEIHRVGRLNKFALTVAIPISENKRQFGLLIIATKNPSKLKIEVDLIKQFSIWVSTLMALFEQFQKDKNNLENLNSKIEKLELFYNNTNDCLLLINEKNLILEFNSSFLNLLDYLPIELLNKNVDVIFKNSPLLSMIDAQSTDNKSDTMLVEVFNRNGNIKKIYAKIVRFISEGNENKLIILNDASEIIASKSNLLMFQKSAALGEILAEFAHDVRNIINRLTTGLQLLNKKINTDESGLSSIQDLQKECVSMTDLMESVLSYTQQNYDKFQSINLGEMIERIFYRAREKAKQANISLIQNSKDSDCMAWIDQRSMERVITNLINNGIEAIGSEGGAVSVNISNSNENPGYLIVKIADTGPGIPPEIQSNLFQKFSSGKPGGTGLGLFISQKIIEYHKGWINIETFPGGTIFNIFIPKEKRGGDQ